MTTENDLFISYSQSDGDVAAALLDLLQTAGVKCFLAEKSIALGAEWDAELRNAILHAKRVLVLVTPNSNASPWVAAEVGAAWVLQKPVIPALQSVTPSQLDGPIKKYQARQVATRREIDELVGEIASLCGCNAPPSALEKPDSTSAELFNSASTWKHLLKVGDWSYDENTRLIRGEGTCRYLLSSATYGSKPYRITCRLRFFPLDPKSKIDVINAGILVGWSIPGTVRKYLSVTISGRTVFAEKVGYRGRNEYVDFQHITGDVPLVLRKNEPYDFSLKVEHDALTVTCNGQILFRTSAGEKITGRVGLRPWRSVVICEKFEVST
ncbi:MAG: toll/interleukin-1 receptor domain-containing protein [Kiritimatiellia bacterium]